MKQRKRLAKLSFADDKPFLPQMSRLQVKDATAWERRMWEYVNGIGSVVGLITGGFVIWERFFRYAPSAFLVAQPLIPGSAQMAAYLRVINRSERPIIIKWPTGIKKDELTIATDHSTRAIIGSLMNGECD